MPDRDDPTTSYDPRSWGGGPKESGAGPEAAPKPRATDSTSFDPRSWTAKPAPMPPGGVPPPPPPAADQARPPRRRSAIAAGAAGVLLLSIGGAIAYVARDKPATEAAPAAEAGPAESGEAPATPAARLTITLSDPGRIYDVLTGAGLSGADAQQASGQVAQAISGGTGEILLALDTSGADGGKKLVRLEATRLDGSGVLLTPAAEGGFKAELMKARLASQVFVRRGEMDTTNFYSSAVAAGITDSLISDFAKAFAFDFDFQWDIKPGDVFEGAFEQDVNPSRQPVGEPRLIYVSMTTETKSRRFYRFKAPGESEAGWFDDNGRSTVRSLMKTPIDGARVTSNFGYRIHPILKYQKLHRGTDFGAPIGTPIFAAGSGVVTVASLRGAAGNMVEILHDNGWKTHYFHMNHFGAGIVVGTHVAQGQTIGEVGTTGRSTGPHLHFEVFIDGQPVDSQTIDTGSGVNLSGAALAAFKKERDRIDLSRSQQNS